MLFLFIAFNPKNRQLTSETANTRYSHYDDALQRRSVFCVHTRTSSSLSSRPVGHCTYRCFSSLTKKKKTLRLRPHGVEFASVRENENKSRATKRNIILICKRTTPRTILFIALLYVLPRAKTTARKTSARLLRCCYGIHSHQDKSQSA